MRKSQPELHFCVTLNSENRNMKFINAKRTRSLLVATTALLAFLPAVAHAWWNDSWATRKKITINSGQLGIKGQLSQVPVLVRLHSGDFDFSDAKDSGADIRFVAGNDKTPLNFHIEEYDPINEMGMIWVQLPKIEPGKPGYIWMYTGNDKAQPGSDARHTFDASQSAVFHFSAKSGMPRDATGNGNNAAQFTGKLDNGSLIGRGAVFDGTGAMTLPASPKLKFGAVQGMTVSMWIKADAAQTNAVLYRQQDGTNSVVLGIEGGKLYASVNGTATPKTADVVPGAWHHVAFSAGKTLTLYLDGKPVADVAAALPDMQGSVTVGKDYTGQMDELEIAGTVRSADWISTAAEGQGADALLLGYGQDEMNGSDSGGETSYFGTILRSVTLDGWVVIGILGVMALISWMVMGLKTVVINKIQSGNKKFLGDFNSLAINDTAGLDADDTEEDEDIRDSQLLIALVGKHDHYQDSTLYRIYHTGIQEIKNRFGRSADKAEQYLTPQAIGSIKASLDATVVRELQKLNNLMVLLTIAISGGPFLGLLGTVVGVMITFAAIAATGDVNVAAIAPGIAAALVATVAGLAVAIPALFGYNYLGSKIKNITADMHVFSDEFVSRITEAYSR